MGQFFTGMESVWNCCAKLAGIKAATATNAAPCNTTELSLENLKCRLSEFIAAVSPSLRPADKNQAATEEGYERGAINLTVLTNKEMWRDSQPYKCSHPGGLA